MRGKMPSASVGEPEDQVKLKPFLGMRPGVYVFACLLLAVIVILFFTLLFPGIANPGSVIVFTSVPYGAALRVDGVYAGTSPCRVFAPKGDHVLEMVLPGFETERRECALQGRLFASLFIPLQYKVYAEMKANDPAAALAQAALDYASWSFGGEPTASWQAPMSLSEGVYRVGNAINDSDAEGILQASARFAVTRAALRELVRAQFLAVGGGLAPSPAALARSAAEIAAYLDANPGSAAWLAQTLPADSASTVISSAWYQNNLAAFAGVTASESLAARPSENNGNAPPEQQIRVGGLLFTGIAGGRLVQGEPFPHQIQIEPFMICAMEVPVPAYADFLDANRQWRPERRDELEKQGLVSGEYLADFGNAAYAGNRAMAGIGNVSWHAAQAYCRWLTEKLPPSLDGWEIRLPTEAQWEFAAKSTFKWGIGIFTGEGSSANAWEWCNDPFAPFPFLSAPKGAVAAVGSPERALRGGSGLNAGTTVETRASLPPAACSPFVSFRPAIARR
jgi:formylglycine-generating enzyme required for sulfatase activity